jgi:hypothetical protein
MRTCKILKLAIIISALAPALLLAGCGENERDRQFAQCRVDATKLFPIDPESPLGDAMADYTSWCMRAAGYKVVTDWRPGSLCVAMSSKRYLYEECYYATGWFEFMFKPTSIQGQPITTLEEASKQNAPTSTDTSTPAR